MYHKETNNIIRVSENVGGAHDPAKSAEQQLYFEVIELGERNKLVASDGKKFKSFAYFTSDIEDARTRICMEYVLGIN